MPGNCRISFASFRERSTIVGVTAGRAIGIGLGAAWTPVAAKPTSEPPSAMRRRALSKFVGRDTNLRKSRGKEPPPSLHPTQPLGLVCKSRRSKRKGHPARSDPQSLGSNVAAGAVGLSLRQSLQDHLDATLRLPRWARPACRCEWHAECILPAQLRCSAHNRAGLARRDRPD